MLEQLRALSSYIQFTMIRFVPCVLIAIFALVVLAPSSSIPCDAVSLVAAADAKAGSGGANADAGADDDEYSAEDDEDLEVEDDDDDDDADDDEDDLAPEDDDAADTQDPDKPVVLDPPGKENDSSYVAPSTSGAVFADNFQDGLSKWTYTEADDYSGKFAIGQGANPTLAGDRALIIPDKARKYGLSVAVPGLLDLSSKSLVVQYELKLDQGMTCGGAYLKLPLAGFNVKKLTGDTPYSIMFGPDKCGSTDKVHFIFQSLNPVTGKLTEHHLKTPPQVANSYDKKTHLYTLIVNADSTFELLVDNEKKSYGPLSEKFDPPVQPLKEIDDPEDKKPADWIDEKEIADPVASKPGDWDEDAPAQIVDDDAKKPDGWLDDEAEQVPDPDAKKPDNWDDSEDGAWEAPLVPNMKCEAAGCGEWKRPMKENPDYKGKWKASMITNPKYIGEWKPKKITNPDYYEVTTPTLLGIAGIAMEIWTMDHGVLFDNVWIGNDVDAAKRYGTETFVIKQKTEIAEEEMAQKKADEEAKKKGPQGSKAGSLGPIMDKVERAINKLEDTLAPLEAWIQKMGFEPQLDMLIDYGIKKPMLVVVSVPLVITLLMLVLLSGGKKKKSTPTESSATVATDTTEAKKTDAVTQDDEPEGDDDAEHIDEQEADDDGGLRQRAVPSGDS